MSRRKQENPQPRKRLVNGKLPVGLQQVSVDLHAAEPEILQDILTCGVCQKDFVLADIVKFIQHKVHSCNKENCLLYEDGNLDSDPDNEGGDGLPVVGSRRPSISAPIAKKTSATTLLSQRLESRDNTKTLLPNNRPPSASLPESNSVAEEPGQEHSRCTSSPSVEVLQPRQDTSELFRPASAKQVVDADTNTTNTEPNSYVCSTCKQTFTSAWVLVQHVQNGHGLKIYVDNNGTGAGVATDGVVAGGVAGVHGGGGGSSTCSTPSLPTVAPVVSQDPATLPLHLNLDSSQHPALQLLRMPLSERQFGPTLNSHGLFTRPSSHDFRMEMIGDQYPRLNHHSNLGGLSHFETTTAATTGSTFERSPFDRPRTTPIGLSFEPQMDFYSQRLRQLAGATSPNTAQSPRKLTPPFSNPLPALPSPQPTTPTSSGQAGQSHMPQSSSSSTSSKASDHPPTSPKLKSCEFCGKSFRFQSNLIVHRRSHTGEKPFKCHICNHACTQASKLKRHMKTHQTKSPGGLAASENNSVGSARSTPDSNARDHSQSNGGNDDGSDGQAADNEEEDEDFDEEEEEEELEEEELEEANNELVAEDLSTRGPSNSTPTPGQRPEKANADRPEARQSLLGEVMEKIGLSTIQQYNEAYKQALEESSAAKAAIKQERPSSAITEGTNASGRASPSAENGHDRPMRDEGNKILGQPSLDFGPGFLGAFDNPFNASKRLKLDLGDRDRDSFYAGLWLPSVASGHRDLYLGLPTTDSDLPRHKPSSESALKSAVPPGLSGSVSPRPGTSSGGSSSGMLVNPSTSVSSLKPKDRRNDTCEYCGKVFKNCSNLTVHRRSHTGEKPYKCELCSYACAQSSKLTRHMKTHGRVGKDVYRCRFCDMPFSVPSTLEKHMRKCVVNQNASAVLTDKDSDSKEVT